MKVGTRLLGLLVAAIAGLYFFRQAAGAWNSVDLMHLRAWPVCLGACGMLVLYLLQVPLAAIVWRKFLSDLQVRLTMRNAYAVMAFTQFGKYLPGNVAHHVGRVAVTRRFGGDLPRLTLSLLYENVFALLAGAHITAIFLIWRASPALERWLPAGIRPVLLAGVTIAAVLVFLLLPRVVAWIQRKRQLEQPPAAFRLSAANAIFGYGIFASSFLSLGFGFALLTHGISPEDGFPFLPLCGAFAAAWVIGVLVPGAPAGLGVREGVLLVMLAGVTSEPASIAAITVLRIVTTLGDLIHLVLGSWLLRGELPVQSSLEKDPSGG